MLAQQTGIGRQTSKQAWMQQARQIRALAHSARPRGIVAIGAPGVGKSLLFGAGIAWLDYLAERPQVLIDPRGGAIDYFLQQVITHLTYLPDEACQMAWERIVYVDMSATDGFVVPFPLYYQAATDRSVREVAERFVHVLRRSEPELATRPIMGWPPLHKIGVYTGMLLYALGFQITEAFDLLQHPQQWHDRFSEAQRRYPTVAEAVTFFRDEYIPARKPERERLTTAFRDRIFPLSLDERLRALFGARTPGINWQTVADKGQTVLIDFRFVLDTAMRRLLLLWVFEYLYTYIKGRGRDPQPFGLIIDEFVALTQKVDRGENPLATELDEFIQQYMRSSQIWLTVGLQNPLQLDTQLQQSVLSLGTYLFGQAATMDAARMLADALFLRDPFWVKHYRQRTVRVSSREWAIQEEPEYMPLHEQLEIYAKQIRSLKQYQFLFRPAESEGTIGTAVYPISIRSVNHDPETGQQHFPERALLTQLRSTLAARSGLPVKTLITEQEARLLPGNPQPQKRRHQPTQRNGTAPTQTEETNPVPDPVSPNAPHGHQRRRRIA